MWTKHTERLTESHTGNAVNEHDDLSLLLYLILIPDPFLNISSQNWVLWVCVLRYE